MRSNSVSCTSISGLFLCVVPALLTTMSIRPNAAIASRAARSTSSRFRNVGAKRDRTAAEPLGGSLGDIASEVQTRHPRALADERFGDAEPEPLTGSRDERGFALQTHA